MESRHVFHTVAFAENVPLADWLIAFPTGRRSTHDVRISLEPAGEVFAYPFGALVFRNVPPERRQAELQRLLRVLPKLSVPAVQEELSVVADPTARPGVVDGTLILDEVIPDRAGVIAHTIAQSAALEYYERIVEDMFGRTDALVERLERRGTVPLTTRPLHRFIGAAVGTRNEVLSVLHLLDEPDETWNDPVMSRIYAELRTEFDLADRSEALETKLRSIQEALELVLDVARDRRLVLLEATVVVLIVLEIVTGLLA